jgi:hypothetical protein
VAQTADGFELILRRRIQLCPDSLPRQAYHAVAEEGAPRSTIEHVRTAALEMSRDAIDNLARETGSLSAAAVAMGRTAIPTDTERILNAHALLHAAEGELYRDVLSEAAAAADLRVVRFLNKEVRSEAAASLAMALEDLERILAVIGKTVGPPWTKDEKDATAAAILALATTNAA